MVVLDDVAGVLGQLRPRSSSGRYLKCAVMLQFQGVFSSSCFFFFYLPQAGVVAKLCALALSVCLDLAVHAHKVQQWPEGEILYLAGDGKNNGEQV